MRLLILAVRDHLAVPTLAIWFLGAEIDPMTHARLWAGMAVMALVGAGCGEGRPSVSSSSAEAKVTGKVTIRGKPMKGGEIRFNPANYQRPDAAARTGKIGNDGTFEVTTLVGHNGVSVTGPEIKKEPALGYANTSIEVESGGSTRNIELPPPTSSSTPSK